MSWDTERQSLQDFFISRWAAPGNLGFYNAIAVPVEYEGAPFDTPTDDRPYITMSVMSGTGRIVQIGSVHLVRNAGVIQHVINTKLGGDGIAKKIGTILAGIWQSKQLILPGNEKIICRAPELKVLGQRAGRFEAVVSVPFTRDEFCAVPVVTTWP